MDLLLVICGGLGHTIAELLRGAIAGPLIGAILFVLLFYGLASIGVRVDAGLIRALLPILLAV